MVFEYRSNLDYFFGTLQVAAAISDTSLVSAAFTNLGADYSTTLYLPLVLHDPATGTREVVWVTNHTAGSTTVTVIRGREGTVARAWPAGTQLVCAPTAARDGLGFPVPAATLPPDAHLGMRVPTTDRQHVVEKTLLAGWQPSVGVASYLDVGPAQGGGVPPVGATILLRGGVHRATSGPGGIISVAFRRPFPNGLICGAATLTQANASNIKVGIPLNPGNAARLNVVTWQGDIEVANITVTFHYLALGH